MVTGGKDEGNSTAPQPDRNLVLEHIYLADRRYCERKPLLFLAFSLGGAWVGSGSAQIGIGEYMQA